MAVLYPQVQLPNPAAFRVPEVDSSWLGNLVNSYQQTIQNQAQNDILRQKAALGHIFDNGVPMLPGTKTPDVSAAAAALLKANPSMLPEMVGGFQYDPQSGAFMQKPSLLNYTGEGMPGQTPGGAGPISAAQREADAEFAKENNEYTSGGRSEAILGQKSLEDAIGLLKNSVVLDENGNPKIDPNTGRAILKPGARPVSGPVPTGMGPGGLSSWVGQTFPNATTFGQTASLGELIKSNPGYASTNYPEALQATKYHQRAVAGGLRGILGSQRGQQLYEQVINATYDANQDPAANIQRLQDLEESMKEAQQAKDAKAKWFREHNGSLQGYTGLDPNDILTNAVNRITGGQGQPPQGGPQQPPPQGAGQPQQAGMAPPPRQAVSVPPQAVAYLRAHPETAAAFQQKYGADPRQYIAGAGR